MLDRLTSMRVFVKAADAGSFTAAGATLGITSQMVGKHVSDLEAKLGTPLIQRTTRRQSLTEIGQQFCERCRVILAETDAAYALAENSTELPRGRLRVSAPVGFGSCRLAPVLTDLLKDHPALEIEVNLTDRYVDVVDEGYDAVLPAWSDWRDKPCCARALQPRSNSLRLSRLPCPPRLSTYSSGVGRPCLSRVRQLVGTTLCRVALWPRWQILSGTGSQPVPGERRPCAGRSGSRGAWGYSATRSGGRPRSWSRRPRASAGEFHRAIAPALSALHGAPATARKAEASCSTPDSVIPESLIGNGMRDLLRSSSGAGGRGRTDTPCGTGF